MLDQLEEALTNERRVKRGNTDYQTLSNLQKTNFKMVVSNKNQISNSSAMRDSKSIALERKRDGSHMKYYNRDLIIDGDNQKNNSYVDSAQNRGSQSPMSQTLISPQGIPTRV